MYAHVFLIAAHQAHFQGMDLAVTVVEVWGCGGVEAADSQRRVKAWESKEILRRRKVSKAASLSESSSLMPRLSVFEVCLAMLGMILSLY